MSKLCNTIHTHKGSIFEIFFFPKLVDRFFSINFFQLWVSKLSHYTRKLSSTKSTNSKQKETKFLFKMGAICSCCCPCAQPKRNISGPIQYVFDTFDFEFRGSDHLLPLPTLDC